MNENDYNTIKPDIDVNENQPVAPEVPIQPTNTPTQVTQTPVTSSTADSLKATVKPRKTKKKINIKLIIILLVLFVGGYFGFTYLTSSGKIINNTNKEKEEEKITFDTEYSWANKYGEFIQMYFEQYELTEFDIAFVNLNNEETPELVINYLNKSKVPATEILYIKNNEVNKTRAFNNASFHLITPIKLKNIEWYLFIKTGNNNLGKYTIASQLIDGTALDATIKATSIEEMNSYNSNYLHSSFELTFYRITKEKFKDNYLTKVNRYTSDKEKIDNSITALQEQYDKYIEDNNVNLNDQKTIKLNNYSLDISTYVGKIYGVDEEGEITSEDIGLVITSLNTLTYRDENLTFTIAGNTITCSNGIVLTATNNNEFEIRESTGPITFRIPVDEEDEKENSN